MARGRLVTLEGIEGVGKTTQVSAILEHLRQWGLPAIGTREPGGSPFADRVRALLLASTEVAPTADAELLLMFAARADHIATAIEPRLAAGTWVISDRFTDATYAYQGRGRGIPDHRIAALETWIQDSLRPDRTLLLDAPVDMALERACARGAADRFEAEAAPFFERVREGYLARASAEPQRFRVIDATREIEHVRAAATAAIDELVAEGERA